MMFTATLSQRVMTRSNLAEIIEKFDLYADEREYLPTLMMVDAAKRASAKRISVVAPFYGYGRQDRKAEGREPMRSFSDLAQFDLDLREFRHLDLTSFTQHLNL